MNRALSAAAQFRAHRYLRNGAAALVLVLLATLPAAAGADSAAWGTPPHGHPIVIAAVPSEFPPLYRLDAAGRAQGFAIDVMNAVARLEKLDIRYRAYDGWPAVQRALRLGEAQVIPNMGITEERRRDFDFTTPEQSVPVSLFVRQETAIIRDVRELKGRTVGVVRTNVAMQALGDVPGIKLHAFPNAESALVELLSGNIDAVAYPQPVFVMLARRIGLENRIKVAGPPLLEIRRAIAVRKGNPELLRKLDRGLTSFLASEAYLTVYTRWFGEPSPLLTASRLAWSIGGLLLLVAVLAVGWRFVSVDRLNQELRRQVEERDLAIAQRQRFQEEMLATENRFRTLVESPLQAIVVHREGVPLFANQSFLDLFGYDDLDALFAMPGFTERYHPDDREAVLGHRAAVNRGERPPRIEFRVIRPDGTTAWVSGAGTQVPWEGGWAHQVTMVDITQRVRAREDLETFFHATNEPLVIASQQGRILRSNRAFAEMLGYEGDLLNGRNLFDLIYPEDLESTAKLAQEVQNRGDGSQVVNFENRYVRADGSLIWVSWRVSSGERGLAYCSARDVTEQKSAQEELRRSQAMLQAIFDGLPLALVIADLDEQRILAANSMVEKVFGYQPEELVGKDSTILHVDRQHFEDLKTLSGPALRETGKWSAEYQMRRKDGQAFPAEMYLTLLRGEDGKWATVIGLIADITDRKQAELELADREARFRAIIESSVDIVTLIDGDGRIVLQSPSIQATLGYSPEERQGKSALEMIHPEDVPEVRGALSRVFAEGGRIERVHARMRHQDGSWRIVENTGRRLANSDTADWVVINSRDITDQQRLEDQLRQSQKMEAIGMLAGGVAHDFNNLLSIILSYSELLTEQLPATSREHDDLQHIIAAGKRAAALTRQLLAFSRRQILKLEVLELGAVVQGVEKMLRRLIGEDVELDVRIDEGMHRVRADAGQLEQVIMNLAVNARDAMPTGGHLEIVLSDVELDDLYVSQHVEARPGHYVMLTVSDSGVGMDEATRKRIFEPFFTTKEQGKGTGLGLATVYGICQQLGGSIQVYSEPGQGTTFRIYLPRVDAPHAGDDAAAGREEMPAGSETVLVVEDEEHVRIATCRMLREYGYTVLEAGDPGRALALCERQDLGVDLLLTDVVMPKMSGRELADRLRTAIPGLRTLYMSGYTDDAIVRHGVLGSDFAFLQKPFSRQNLLEAVRKVLDTKTTG